MAQDVPLTERLGRCKAHLYPNALERHCGLEVLQHFGLGLCSQVIGETVPAREGVAFEHQYEFVPLAFLVNIDRDLKRALSVLNGRSPDCLNNEAFSTSNTLLV